MAENSEKTAKRRGPGKPFKKGDPSPNPGGRPKVDPDVKAMLKAATPRAVMRLIELMESPDEAIAAKCSIEIINRELGKTVDKVDLNLVDDTAADLAEARRRAVEPDESETPA